MTRHRWVVPAVVAAACVVGAVAAPSSWWGVGLAVASVAAMLLAGSAVPERSRDGWRWGAALTAVVVVLLAGIYAFLVEPFGPRPTVAIVFAILLGTVVAGVVLSS